METEILDQTVDAIRQFNRFYTQKIGVLTDHVLETPYTLTEARVLFELGSRGPLCATHLIDELGIDPGYLSRMLASFESSGLILRSSSTTDRRKRIAELTAKGLSVYQRLVNRARDDIRSMLDGLPNEKQRRMMRGLEDVRAALNGASPAINTVQIRTHRPGDIGWIIERHGEIYHEEYNWDISFEILVMDIMAELMKSHDPDRDRIWIAEVGGERAGCILATRADNELVKLRLFLVEPWARGRGVGRRLIEELIAFSKSTGYKKITLWTQSCLEAARHLYQAHGFQKVAEEKHHSFGHDLVGETWELQLKT
jgi:DNA-binding MarR family transcriptional regulator/GNAT superfamily N-acetyltransferase